MIFECESNKCARGGGMVFAKGYGSVLYGHIGYPPVTHTPMLILLYSLKDI